MDDPPEDATAMLDPAVGIPCSVSSSAHHESNGIALLVVYRSPLVEVTDQWMTPVHDLLATRCFEEIATLTEEDDRMMFGEAVHTVYRMFDECPDWEHNCRIERTQAHG